MRYDDELLSCSTCSIGLRPEALCDCDTDPKCVRCHRIYDVEGFRAWGLGGVA